MSIPANFSPLIFLRFIYVLWVCCLHVCLYTMYVGRKEGIEYPRTGTTEVVNHHMVAWNHTVVLLKELWAPNC